MVSWARLICSLVCHVRLLLVTLPSYGCFSSKCETLASYLLVISSRTELGNCEFTEVSCEVVELTVFPRGSVLNEAHPVYAIKTVYAIPLSEERATAAVNTLLLRNSRNPRTSLLPPTDGDVSVEGLSTQPQASGRVVKFADGDDIKVMTPLETQGDNSFADVQNNPIHSPSPSSGRSSPSSELSQTGPVERTIAGRLAFWNRFSRRGGPDDFSDSYPVEEPNSSLDTIIARGRQEPAEVLEDIIATAPAPTTQEETHNQLEDKIVRETIREFSKGGMYFAYNFGQWLCPHLASSLILFAGGRYYPVFAT